MVCATSHRMFLNVGYDLTEKQVRAFFDTFGPVTDVYLPRQANGRNKGFGFATFGDAEALQAALKISAHKIGGFTVQVKRAGPRPSEPDSFGPPAVQEKPHPVGRGSCRLYVGGVADVISVLKIRRHFGAWGKIVHLSVCGKDASKRTKNCFVTYESPSSAEKAHDQSPRSLDGWPVTCISLTECSKIDASEKPTCQADAEIVSQAAEEAQASNLQAQIAASGCSNWQQYAVWLQARYQLLASSVGAEQHTSASDRQIYTSPDRQKYTAPASTLESAAFLNSQLQNPQYQNGYLAPSASAPTMSPGSYLSSNSTSCHPQPSPASYASEQAFPYSDFQPAPSQALSPLSYAPAFPGWSDSVSSDSASSGYFSMCEAPSHQPSPSAYSALELQARLDQLQQLSADPMQPGQSQPLGQPYKHFTGPSQQGNYAVGPSWVLH